MSAPDFEPSEIDLHGGRRRERLQAVERLPAHSLEAEQGALGCVFLQPNECLSLCQERFRAGAEVFYDLRHRTIYEVLTDMFDRREAIDIISVQNRLGEKGKLAEVGGIAYLASLPDVVPSAANVTFYLNIILEKFLLRRVLAHCLEFSDRVYENGGEVAQLIEEFEGSALAVAQTVMEEANTSVKAKVQQRLAFYEECQQRGGGLIGLSSGYPDLDHMTDGFKPGEMIVIAARPSVGKTSLAMNIAEHVALAGVPVGVFSLEMSADALVGRMIASRARVNERQITKGMLNDQENRRVFTSGVQIAKAPLQIDDTGGLTITQMRAKGRRMRQQHGVGLFVVDYLQLLRTAKRRDNRQEEIADISNGVKSMAKELGVPIIVLAQLNRDVAKEKNRKPRMEDLRESGQIEQDADLIGLLYPVDPEQAQTGNGVIPVNLLIAKQRNGPTGDVSFTFFKDCTRFESVSKVADP